MKHGWDAVFARKSSDKPVPIETHPYVCVICNSDMEAGKSRNRKLSVLQKENAQRPRIVYGKP